MDKMSIDYQMQVVSKEFILMQKLLNLLNKFKRWLKFISKTSLDYGSGRTDLNKVKLKVNKRFIDYIGLKKINTFKQARRKDKKIKNRLKKALNS